MLKRLRWRLKLLQILKLLERLMMWLKHLSASSMLLFLLPCLAAGMQAITKQGCNFVLRAFVRELVVRIVFILDKSSHGTSIFDDVNYLFDDESLVVGTVLGLDVFWQEIAYNHSKPAVSDGVVATLTTPA